MSPARSSFYKVFLSDDSPDVEVFSGITALLASISHIVFSTELQLLYWIATVIFTTQIISAYPIHDLKLRHNTNILSFAIALIISYINMPNDLMEMTLCKSAAVGGYAGVALTCLYSSFKTEFQRKSIKK